VDTLAPFFPRLRSLAVVPLGLTKHRKGLPRLRPVDAAAASAVLRFVRRTQKRFLAAMGERFLYASDEFYLLAGASIPPASHYGDFWQSDNGVGMVRAFLSDFRRSRRSFPKSLERPARFVVATGTLAGPVLRRHVLPVLNRIGRARFVLAVIPNRFFGESVTVSGLLAGRDVAAVLGRIRGSYTALLPSNCLNADGLFLDDWTLDRLSAATGRPVRALDSFSDALRNA
jgi:NifB/MoaA-like Fe-S oxidoreductase